jgi:ABC-type multidrug transport system ATPase subunit
MVLQTLKCPKCGNTISIEVVPGETTSITCPKCHSQGVFTLPSYKKEKTITSSPAIEVHGLVKIFNGVKAVNNVSFTVQTGEIFGFLGPNGAGKTTTIKSILDLIHPNNGSIRIRGIDIANRGKVAKKYVGYLPEKVAFYENLTALQNLSFYAEMKQASKDECATLLEEFGLAEAASKKVGTFSKGMIQRLGMARALLGHPPILILDEPSGGLDPRGVILIRDKIRKARKQGATIFVSSHILSEIQEICDRVGIINRGVLVAKDTVSELSKKLQLKPRLTVELETMTPKVVEAVNKIKGVENIKVINKIININCDSKAKAKVILAIATAGGNIVNLYISEPSLEEVFMRYTEEESA